MEVGRSKASGSSSGSGNQGFLKIVYSVSWGIVKNPIFFMTALGLIGNIIFNSNVPPILTVFLNVSIMDFCFLLHAY